MFRASRLLLFAAKTAVKDTGATKKKAAVTVAKKEKVVTKARDPSLPPRPIRYSLPDLIELIPKPEPGTAQEDWQHKGGWGLKFYRKRWARYAEPSYWTVTRYKPSTHGHKRKVWGLLTWRGVTEERPREVSGQRKREWRYLQEDDFKIPFPKTKRRPPPKPTAAATPTEEKSSPETAAAT